ncbi:MAG: hypothetical protein FJ087_03160 [Deltaproteobacteria bacterium]|nr:hypothetical protein [Deltaproteobacteria bacterium]
MRRCTALSPLVAAFAAVLAGAEGPPATADRALSKVPHDDRPRTIDEPERRKG